MVADRSGLATAPDRPEHRACLGLGSNREPERFLRLALARLRELTAVQAVSTAWESPDIDGHGPDYVNAAVAIRTPLGREPLIAQLKALEAELGRQRHAGPDAGVTIDLDLILFDDEVLEADLWTQAHRALPVSEVVAGLRAPGGESLGHLAANLAVVSPIRPRPELLPEATVLSHSAS